MIVYFKHMDLYFGLFLPPLFIKLGIVFGLLSYLNEGCPNDYYLNNGDLVSAKSSVDVPLSRRLSLYNIASA